MKQQIQTISLVWDATAFERDIPAIMFSSLRKNGFLDMGHGPLLTPLGDNYLVVTGRRITRVAAMLGIQVIPCRVEQLDQQPWSLRELRIKESTPPWVKPEVCQEELEAIAKLVVNANQQHLLTREILKAKEELAIRMIRQEGCTQTALKDRIGDWLSRKFWRMYKSKH